MGVCAQGNYHPPKGAALLYYSIGTEIHEDTPTTAHLRVTHCEVLCWIIPFWRMTSTESLIIVCFCPEELQYNPSTTGIFLVSIQYLKLTRQMQIFGLQYDSH